MSALIPIESFCAGALAVLTGYYFGRRNRKTAEPETVKATCGCKHGIWRHESATGECHGEDPRDAYNKHGDWVGKTYVRCTCKKYTGPIPMEQFISPTFLPPE